MPKEEPVYERIEAGQGIDGDDGRARPNRALLLLISWGSMLGMLLPLVVFGVGGCLYLARASISPELITDVIKPQMQIPLTLKYTSALVVSVASALILGPPTTTKEDMEGEQETTVEEKCKAMGKCAYIAYLLGSSIWKVYTEYYMIGKQVAAVWPGGGGLDTWYTFVVQVIEIWAIAIGTGSNIGSVADLLCLAFAFHDRLNFIGVHNRDMVRCWKEGKKYWVEEPYARVVGTPPRASRVLQDMIAANGCLYGIYAVILAVFYLPYAFFFGMWGVITCTLFYPWIVLIAFTLGALIRVVGVDVLIHWVVSRSARNSQDERFQVAENGVELVPYKQDETDDLRDAIYLVTDSQGGPYGIERRFPGFMYFSKGAYKQSEQVLRDKYNQTLATLYATGLTSDGWTFIISLSALLKTMFDLLPVIMMRFATGHGYWASVLTSLSERTLQAYLANFKQSYSAVFDVVFRTT